MLEVKVENKVYQCSFNDDVFPHSVRHVCNLASRGTDLSYVMATGPELDYILNNFKMIPRNVQNNRNTWRGEYARFIMDNLLP